MENVRTIYLDWNTGGIVRSDNGAYLARQYDHLSNLVAFRNAPGLENYYLIVEMKEDEDDLAARSMEPILLPGPYWLVPNVYTQLVQPVTFQVCCKTESGDFEQHSAKFRLNVIESMNHDGAELDVDPSPMFDAYEDYVDEKVQELIDEAGGISIDTRAYVDQKITEMVAAAGEVIIDSTLSISGAAADAKATGDAISNTNERLDNYEGIFTGDVGESVQNWLEEHPEATTTVEDGSLTYKKMVNGTLGFVTPEMYGAVGDGTTDDTSAVISAFNSGKPVYGAKTYNVNIENGTFPNLRIMGGKYVGKINCTVTNFSLCNSEIDGYFHFTLLETTKTYINNNIIRNDAGLLFAVDIGDFELIECCNNVVKDFVHYILYVGQSTEGVYNGNLVLVKNNTVRGHAITERVHTNNYYVFVLAECERVVFADNDCRNWSSSSVPVVCHDLCGECRIVEYYNNYLEDIYSVDVNDGERYLIRAKNGSDGVTNGFRSYSNSKYKITVDLGYYIARSQNSNTFIIDNCEFDIAFWKGSYTAIIGSETIIKNCRILAHKANATFFTKMIRVYNTEIVTESAEANFDLFRGGDTIIKDSVITDKSGHCALSAEGESGTFVVDNCILSGLRTMGVATTKLVNTPIEQLGYFEEIENCLIKPVQGGVGRAHGSAQNTDLLFLINGDQHTVNFSGNADDGYTLDGVQKTNSELVGSVRFYHSGFYYGTKIFNLTILKKPV